MKCMSHYHCLSANLCESEGGSGRRADGGGGSPGMFLGPCREGGLVPRGGQCRGHRALAQEEWAEKSVTWEGQQHGREEGWEVVISVL